MAVVTQYVVERNGVARMTFTSKQQADAYDKMLDLAEQLEVLLGDSQLLEQQQLEDLALYLAQQKEDLLLLIQGKASKSVKKPTVQLSDSDTESAGATLKKVQTVDSQLEQTAGVDDKGNSSEHLSLVTTAA